jgi:hypothetical protein
MPLGFTFRSDAESILPRTIPAAAEQAGKLSFDSFLSMLYVALEPFADATEAVCNMLRKLPRDMKVVPT